MTKKLPPKKKKAPAKMGRQTKYDPEFHPHAAWTLAITGKTAKEIAKGLRISTATLDAWQNIYPDFLSSIKAGKGIADSKVEQALFKRATGYEYDEKKKVSNVYGEERTELTKKQVVPDVTAQIFWLKNRKSKDWRDVSKREHTGEDGAPIKVENTIDIAAEVKKLVGILPAVKL